MSRLELHAPTLTADDPVATAAALRYRDRVRTSIAELEARREELSEEERLRLTYLRRASDDMKVLEFSGR